MIDTVLFDLDGTLIDSNHLIITTFKYVFETELPHIQMKEEDYFPFIGPTLVQGFGKYVQDEAQIQHLIQVYRKKNLELHDDYVKAFEGAQALLIHLKSRGIQTGIVSSKMHFLIERGLKVTGLLPYFDVIIGSDDVVNHKPHPEPIQKALSLFDDIDEAIYVGDHPNDILSGKAAGIKTIGMNYSWNLEDLKKAKADYYLDTLIQIKEVI
ncbi:HAD-IA family hydrolase [Paracholeplasma manati]|uniref:HAD-IA family hydrolase n=1 Tax=Paracholeplasma manati TaxID=591373 RepID=A0ABT2Y3Q2_9MOLU|nr:HAD-IA family hydrolase [Paracholeplasma manati]MCV2231364.1 HAD-IA family hydrolase [Paracholeplasma manati]MDG0888444.1 HAD-IA family hydrolase [Paracholeplasma manati]